MAPHGITKPGGHGSLKKCRQIGTLGTASDATVNKRSGLGRHRCGHGHVDARLALWRMAVSRVEHAVEHRGDWELRAGGWACASHCVRDCGLR